MPLTRIANKLYRHFPVLQRLVHLFGVADEGVVVLFTVNDESRRLNAVYIGARGEATIDFKVFPIVGSEILVVPTRVGGVAEVGLKVKDAEKGDGGFKTVGVRDDPIGHVASV